MRIHSIKLFLTGLFVIANLSCLPVYAAEEYQFDAGHTYIIWQVSHFGFSNVSGKLMAEGTLELDQVKPANSVVNVVIHTLNMNTGIPRLDEILTGKNFFNSAEFPTATFKSTKVVVTSKDKGKIYGVLTLNGKSKEVVLDAVLNRQGMHPFFNKQALGFSANATVNRSDFGMRGYLPGVSDAVTLEIQAEAVQVK